MCARAACAGRFHTIPHPGEFGYDTWPPDAWKSAGAANNWAGMALDEHRGIVYVPTGSAVFDFYGADRVGNDLFADTLLALDAKTGKRLWHFQGVHHDIWDRDFPSPPALLSVRHNGGCVDAVAQITKQGFLYLFDRTSGKPLFPIEERHYPASEVPGEVASPYPAFTRYASAVHPAGAHPGSTDHAYPEAHEKAVKDFATFRSGRPVSTHRTQPGDSRLPLLPGWCRMGWPGRGSQARGDLCERKRDSVCACPDGEQPDRAVRAKGSTTINAAFVMAKI